MDQLRLFFGPNSAWFWTMLQFIAVATSLFFIARQLQHLRQANMVQALRDLDERWRSTEMRDSRRICCQRYVESQTNSQRLSIDRRHGNVRGFFEALGVYHRRGILDDELIWDRFSYYIDYYWTMYEPNIREFRIQTSDESWFERFEILNGKMVDFAKRGRYSYGGKTQKDIAQFIRVEVESPSDEHGDEAAIEIHLRT